MSDITLAHALDAERSERQAFGDLLQAAATTTAAPQVGSFCDGADGLVVDVPTLPLTVFNRVMGLGLAAGPDTARLAGLFARLGRELSPHFAIQPSPGALGDAWRDWLRAQGYAPCRPSFVQMARCLVQAPQPPGNPAPGLRVIAAGVEDAQRFAATALAGFGMPAWSKPWLRSLPGRRGWHCFIAEADGTAVAVGALYVRAGLGWLGMGTTLAAYRRRGAQRSLMAARLARATELGCRLATTETGAPQPGQPHPSYSNMVGCGFQQVALRTSWARP